MPLHPPPPLTEQIIEIVSDSGEGAQKCGQIFATLCAKSGYGVWTVEIIPAEIQPPARSPAGASGIRIRIGSHPITNMGDEADLAIAFNEQVLYSRIAAGAYRDGTQILLESRWGDHPPTATAYRQALTEFRANGLLVTELALEAVCLPLTTQPRQGKNMVVLGLLCALYQLDPALAATEIERTFGTKGAARVTLNQRLFEAGYRLAAAQPLPPLALAPPLTAAAAHPATLVSNGNQALALGIMAAGIDLVSIYPITPATSVSHYLAPRYAASGGFIHQAEDEIAAIGFALGASYAGKTACTLTSGPGLALKTEMIGLAVMGEVPLVIIDVQRGGPSTGLPTKVEQSDLFATIMGETGDAPKIVLAAATISDCFHLVILARQLAEAFRMPVVLLSDANLATAVQPWPRPTLNPEWLAAPPEQSDWQRQIPPYDWHPTTGLSSRPIPGQSGGMYVMTGLAHTREAKVAYDPQSNQLGMSARSHKLAALQSSLKPPPIFGAATGDLLVVSWGSTLGAVEEAVGELQQQGLAVSSLHLRFLSPLEPGLGAIFAGFRRVMTVEINYGDDPTNPLITADSRRYPQLATLLRAKTLVDIESWGVVYGQPLQPRLISDQIHQQLLSLINPSNGLPPVAL